MGRGSETIFLQGRQTDCQQTYAKMPNISNHQGNANQNHKEISPHTGQNRLPAGSQQTASAGEDVERREPWALLWECRLAATVESSVEGPQDIKHRITT